jgi:hypothetical protein
MTRPIHRTTMTEPARAIGDHFHGDIIPLKSKSVGGNNFILAGVDEKSSYGFGVPTASKAEKFIKAAAEEIMRDYNTHGHQLRQVTTDDESALALLDRHLGPHGVKVHQTPADLHEKSAERFIRTIKNRKRSMLCSLWYEPLPELECEAYCEAIAWYNRLPNTVTGPNTTPYTLFTGKKSFIPTYGWGWHGLFYNLRKDRDQRAEWGIFIGYGKNEKYLRCYNPITRTVTSKMRFAPQRQCPTSWGLKSRFIPKDRVPRSPSTPTAPALPAPAQTATGNNNFIQTGLQYVPAAEGVDPGASDPAQANPTPPVEPLPAPASPVQPVIQSRTPVQSRQGGEYAVQPSASPQPVYTPPQPVYTPVNDMVVTPVSKTPVKAPRTRSAQGGDSQGGDSQGGASPTPAPRDSGVTQAVPVPSPVSQSSDRLQLPTERPRRTNVGTYKDGPARLRSTANEADVVGEDKKDFRSGKERFRAKLAYIHEFNNPHGIFSVIALKMSLRNALNDPNRRSAIQKAIYAEIDNFESPGVVQPIKFKNIPKDKLKEIIGVYMFHREKYKGDGIFDKDKCRIVLLSNLRDPDTIGDSTSPTVNPISVMTQINLAAVTEGTCIAAYDIKGAFLLTPMKPGVRMFIRINPDVATHWIMRYPARAKWLQNDGCLYFELNRYVYGLHEASNEFNSMLDKQLQDIGFKPSVADRCLYTKKVEDGIIVMSVHVDDMLLTAPNRKWQKWFEDEMEKKFTLVKQYDNISYLGMQIKHDRESGNITVSQNGYLRTMLKKYKLDNLNKFPPTSASENLTDIDHDSPGYQQEGVFIISNVTHVSCKIYKT